MSVRWVIAAVAVASLVAGPGAARAQSAAEREALLTRGQYLVTIMDCGGCHTPGALTGLPDASRRLAGSDVGFGFPGGVVYPPNLTPDADTGLGRWSEEEIIRAFRQGQSRDGRPLVPIMPWPSYSALTPDDARAIAAFLRSLPPVRNAAPRNVRPGETPPAPYLSVVPPK